MRRTALLAGAVVMLAFGLRVAAVSFGFPLLVHPDEAYIVEPALDMAKRASPVPRSRYDYPGLYYQHQATAYALAARVAGAPSVDGLEPTTVYRWGRTLTAALSALTVWVVYRSGVLIAGPTAGLLGALLLALSPLHVEHSYTVTVDNPTALWVAVALLGALRIRQRRRLRDYLLCALGVGLAGGTKYNAALVGVLLPLAHGLRVRELRGFLDARLLAGLVTIPLVFLLTTPAFLLDFERVWSGLSYQAQHYAQYGHPGYESDATSFRFYLSALAAGFGVLPLLAAGLGALRGSRRDTLLCLAGSAVLFVFAASFRVHFARNLAPVLPGVAVLGGVGLAEALRRLEALGAPRPGRFAPLVSGLLLVAVLAQPALGSIETVRRARLPDTRWVALQWMQKNLPEGARVAREHYAPPLERDPRFRVTYLGYAGAIQHHWFERLEEFDVIVLSSGDYERYFREPERYREERRRYEELFDHLKLVREVQPGSSLSGPTIRIYVTPSCLHRSNRLMNRAVAAMRRGADPEQVSNLLDAAEGACPANPRIHVNRALLEEDLGRDDRARAYFERALVLAGGDPEPAYFYARFLAERGERDRARRLLAEALARDPEHDAARALLQQLGEQDPPSRPAR